MKPSVFPHMVATLLLGIAPMSAQNPVSAPRFSETSTADAIRGNSERRFSEASPAPGNYDVPAVEKARGELPDGGPVYASQDPALNSRAATSQNVDAVVDLGILRDPSPYKQVAVKSGPQPYEVETESLQSGLEQISAVYRESGKPAEKASDCPVVALAVSQQIKLDGSKILEIVEAEVGANPGCACEIVKMSIKSSEADVPKVVAIVEAAINAAPDNMRMISQCAIASMPDSISAVQALLAKLDPNSGDDEGSDSKSAKSAKSAKEQVAAIVAPIPPNPLDLPPLTPPIVPPTVIPPPVTNVNP